jgi:trk system potassium uptake protein TrkA
VHIVIMGCGRVGSALANELDSLGHSVAVIDSEAKAFKRLRPGFGGSTVTGIGFDRDVLIEAGIERADAFAAVSSGDNSNILAARVARETFGVEHVVARIYDLRRAEVYERLGIPTVATVAWTTAQMMRRILPAGALEEWRDPSGALALGEVHVDPSWIGRRVSSIADATGTRIAFITRYGEAQIPSGDTVLQENDLVHLIYKTADRDRIEAMLATAPEVH